MDFNDNRQEKIIYKAYKQFYAKQPNLNEENKMNISIEIQSMAFLLNEYGVNLGINGFVKEYKNLDLPMDIGIQDVIIQKLIGKNAASLDSLLQFNERAEKYIDIVGSTIRSIINDSEKPIETLRTITNILYTKKYVCPIADDEKIKELTNCTENDLKNENMLVQLITNELCKDNFNEANIENVRKMIDESDLDNVVVMKINEKGTGKDPIVSDESRKILVKNLLK